MLPDEIFGAPTHALVVHVVVVLLPLSALGAVVAGLVPRFGRRYASLFAVGAVVCVPAVLVAVNAGETLERQVNASLSGSQAALESSRMEEHTRLGDSLLPWVIVLAVGAVAVAVVARMSRDTSRVSVTAGGRADEPPLPPARNLVIGRWVAVVVTLVGAAMSIYLVIRIGHLGAEAAWTRVTSDG